jgi:secondary thiamine-phosphate synthase enzyme
MSHYQKLLTIPSTPKSFVRITSQVADIVAASGIQTGLCTLFLRHTSASLVIQENADPDVLIDLANFLAKLVPEDSKYIHSAEGVDDMPAHIRTSLCGKNAPLHLHLTIGNHSKTLLPYTAERMEKLTKRQFNLILLAKFAPLNCLLLENLS